MSLWKRYLLISYLIVVGVIPVCPCSAEITSPATLQDKQARIDIIDNLTIEQDPRLNKPVSLSKGRLLLKTVLNEFSAQTGVAMTIDGRDPASGYSVLIECNQVPVGKMMNALYSLMSIRGGEWNWTRYGKESAYTYTFHETPGAKNRGAIHQNILNGLMSNYVAVMNQLAPLTMDERRLHKDDLKKALFLDDGPMIDFYFENESFWNEANFFCRALNREQQQAILEGKSITVVLNTLPHDVYNFYHQAYLQMDPKERDETGKMIPVPEPLSVQFSPSYPDHRQERLAPAILVSDSMGAVSWMGTGCLEFGVRDAIKKAWLLPSDRASDAASNKVVESTPETEGQKQEREADEALLRRLTPDSLFPNRRKGLKLDTDLQQLASGTSTPLLAILHDQLNSDASPVGKPMQQFLDRLEGNFKTYMVKWDQGMLLVAYPEWFTDTTPAIPYSLLHNLHPDKHGEVPLTELLSLMHHLSDDQAVWFAAKQNISNLSQLRPCLLFAVENPRVLMSDGLVIDDETLRTLQSASIIPSNSQLSTQDGRIRLKQEMSDVPGVASTIRVEWNDIKLRTWKLLNRVPLPLCSDLLSR